MKKIKLSTKPTLVFNDSVHTIEFKLIYPVVGKHEYKIYNNYLSHLLSESTKLYPDESEFQKEKLRKTVLDYGFYTNNLVNNSYLIFTFSLPQEGLVSDYDLEESFKFIVDCIKNPIVLDEELTRDRFNHAKEFFLKKHESVPQEIYGSNDIDFRNIVDPDERIGFSYTHHGEFIKNVSWEDLKNYYVDSVINNHFISYVHGNISEEKINYLFEKYLPQDKDEIEFTINYRDYLPLAEVKTHVIETTFNQAEVIMQYQVDGMKESDRIKLASVINILNAQENNLIFDSLRVKNGLVYDAYAGSYGAFGFFTVEAFIDSKNTDKVISLVNEVMESLLDKEKLTTYFEKLKVGYKVDLLKEDDSLYKDLNNRINDDLDISTVRKDYDLLMKLDIDDLIKFIKQIKLTNTIIFKEAKHD